MQEDGTIAELILVDGMPAARILCAPRQVPVPGKYLLALADESDSPLASSIFAASSLADGFLAAPPIPKTWTPGTHLHLRGPLGHGFELPEKVRRIGLIAFDDSPRRLLPLLDLASKQDAAITLVCAEPPEDLPLQVEVQPLRALNEVSAWADYLAIDAARESLPELKSKLGLNNLANIRYEAQVLVRVPMPCGGLAECGVCAVAASKGRRLACEDGPVFDLKELI
jgi:dihydroorotate dehydrogenase electron transfer subunit